VPKTLESCCCNTGNDVQAQNLDVGPLQEVGLHLSFVGLYFLMYPGLEFNSPLGHFDSSHCFLERIALESSFVSEQNSTHEDRFGASVCDDAPSMADLIDPW
jgi:hypothetical protein